jgi:hypothetical protein
MAGKRCVPVQQSIDPFVNRGTSRYPAIMRPARRIQSKAGETIQKPDRNCPHHGQGFSGVVNPLASMLGAIL